MRFTKDEWFKLFGIMLAQLAVILVTLWRVSLSIEHRFTVLESQQAAIDKQSERERQAMRDTLVDIRDELREARRAKDKP